jgi:hypothetical protein
MITSATARPPPSKSLFSGNPVGGLDKLGPFFEGDAKVVGRRLPLPYCGCMFALEVVTRCSVARAWEVESITWCSGGPRANASPPLSAKSLALPGDGI